ncbi:MAG: EF-P lysine aminoacylase GenX [Xanthomonadales bacterium]|nr:EF-P lysine aminoacylase GenX [Xanthomonadales bacterium]
MSATSNQSPLSLLRQRAFLLTEIRTFFQQRKVLEVETPILSSAANTDLQIEVFSTQPIKPDKSSAFLRTSPEFFHKRLLAQGSGDIFEMAKVFRYGETTRLHNPEFTLLEWYRLDFDLKQLMFEVVELVQYLRQQMGLDVMTINTCSYQQIFIEKLSIDPFKTSADELNRLAIEAGYHGEPLDLTAALDFMFAIRLEPQLQKDEGYLIYDFPVEQAALSQVHPDYPDRCLRFEFLWGGVELANGYQELTDANEQLKRFEQDNHNRQIRGKDKLPIDQHLITALQQGLPGCSGVAVGVDRLLMCLLGKDDINEVLAFMAKNS